MSKVTIKTSKSEDLVSFLELAGFEVEDVGSGVYRVVRDQELPVFLRVSEQDIYFEVDLGNVQDIANEQLYFELLNLNTEIQPVSLGIDTSAHDDPRLVMVERRETGDLCDQELLAVFDALELASDRTAAVLESALAARASA